MLVLGIESTCDETAASIVKDGSEILSNIIATQTATHEKCGGVFPELASRCHLDLMIPSIEKAIKDAKIKSSDIDLIAVANGPGLMGSLLMGVNAAKSLSFAWDIPLVGVNHVKAHMYSPMMEPNHIPKFPALGIVISGGHTFLAKITSTSDYTIISSTVDDAIGEAFDKVARMLGLPYPGGPEIEKLAKKGDPNSYSFKPGLVKRNPLAFSFSGLKTNVLYTIKGQNGQELTPKELSFEEKCNIAASFQKTALLDIVKKSLIACDLHGLKSIYIGGGVSNNKKLKTYFEKSPYPIYFPGKLLSLDNAAMIAGLGYHEFRKNGPCDTLELLPYPRFIHKQNQSLDLSLPQPTNL